MDEKFKDFLRAYWNAYAERCKEFAPGSIYIPVPSLMKALSKKWGVTQKAVNDYLASLPFENGKFFVSKCPPRAGRPKTHCLKLQGGRMWAYFIQVSVSGKNRYGELSQLERSDLESD